jgi:GT2 family glycosyltransferase
MPSGRPERLVVLGLDESMPAVRFLRDVVVRLEARGIGLPPIAVVTTRSLKRWRQKALVRLADGLTTEIALRQIASDRLLEEIGASRTLVLLPWQTLSRAATLTALATGGVSFLGVEHPTATAAFTPKTAQNALIPLNPNLWADRIAAALEGNWPAPKPRTGDLDPVLLTPPLAATPVKTATPLVSICLMHFERPRMIDLALRSIEAQDYPKLEVVLLDDGSRSKASVEKLDSLEKDFARRDWRVVRQQNRYLGAARNAAAATAKGEYLYFLDDDNALKPGAIASLVSAAEHSRADAVVSYADFFDTDEPPSTAPARHIPLGNAPALGLFLNAFGDSNALIRRSSFDALGGNREEYGVGKEDHEFYARLVLSGRRFVLLPEAVYWYRQSPGRLRSRHYAGHAGNLRILEAYAAAAPEWGEDIFLIAQGLMGHRASRGAATGEHSHTGGPLVGASDASLQLPGLHRFFRSVLAFENRAFGGFLELQARAAMGLANAIRGVRRLVRKNGTGSR